MLKVFFTIAPVKECGCNTVSSSTCSLSLADVSLYEKEKKKELKKLSFLLNLLELKLVLNLIHFLFVHYFLKITMSYNYISVKTFLAFSCINVGKSFHLFIHYL